MNEVSVSTEGVTEPTWVGEARAFALRALGRLGKEDWDLSILLCGDELIADLNLRYRSKEGPTDVLSFEQGEEYEAEDGSRRFLAGDIVISLPALARNAAEFGVDEGEERERLVLHGILHLSGLDHEDDDPSRPMLRLQEEILAELRARPAGGSGPGDSSDAGRPS